MSDAKPYEPENTILYAKVCSKIFFDMIGLRRDARLIALYLIASKHVNRIGLYPLSIAYGADDLEMSLREFEKGMGEVCERFGWKYDTESRVVWIRQFFKYNSQHVRSSKLIKGALLDLSRIPQTRLLIPWAEGLKRSIDRIKDPSLAIEVFDLIVQPRLDALDGVEVPEKPVTPPESTAKASKPKEDDPFLLSFFEFWNVYPKKKAKPQAFRAWRTINPDTNLRGTIVADVVARAKSEDWTKENRQFCPYPATYLNQRRWEDEAPEPEHNANPTVFQRRREENA